VQACSLEADLAVLPAGRHTEIGERGVNLSGGQKARVSMARAMYADTEFIIMDDPLSAVDVHVGRHMFNQCIRGASDILLSCSISSLAPPVACMLLDCTLVRSVLITALLTPTGALESKTRLLVTNQLQYLPQADQVHVPAGFAMIT